MITTLANTRYSISFAFTFLKTVGYYHELIVNPVYHNMNNISHLYLHVVVHCMNK